MNHKLSQVVQPTKHNEDLTDSLTSLLTEKERQIKEQNEEILRLVKRETELKHLLEKFEVAKAEHSYGVGKPDFGSYMHSEAADPTTRYLKELVKQDQLNDMEALRGK